MPAYVRLLRCRRLLYFKQRRPTASGQQPTIVPSVVAFASLSPLVEIDTTRCSERLRRKWRSGWLPLLPLPAMLLLLLTRPHTPSNDAGDAVRGLQEEKHDANPIAPCGRPRKSVKLAHARVISSSTSVPRDEILKRRRLFVVRGREGTRIQLSTPPPPKMFFVGRYLNHTTPTNAHGESCSTLTSLWSRTFYILHPPQDIHTYPSLLSVRCGASVSWTWTWIW